MANEQVRIDLVADDKASAKIDDLADDVEALDKLAPEVTVTADDKASTDLADIKSDAEALDQLAPEIAVGVDDKASGDLADIKADAEAITRADHELVLKARIDAARGELSALRTDLEQTADKAVDVNRRMDDIGSTRGPGLAGNAVADLTGPLGDASSAASDIAGVFEGLGDITGAAASKVGMDAEKMAGAVTGIGFAVTAIATAWAFVKQRQEEARENQKRLAEGQREINRAIEEGDRLAAAEKLVDLYGEAFDAADQLGVKVGDLTAYITGQTDAIPGLNDEIEKLTEQIEANGGAAADTNVALLAQKDDLEDVRKSISGAREDYQRANGTLADQDRRLAEVSAALDVAKVATDQMGTASEQAARKIDQTSAALDRLRGDLDIEQAAIDFERAFATAVDNAGQDALDAQADVLAFKQTVIDTGEALKQDPIEIDAVLNQIEQGDLVGAYNDVQTWFDQRPVYITIGARTQRLGFTPIGGGQIVIDAQSAPSIGVVNMTLPAGWRGDPTRTAHAQRRRTGRYFARTA